MRFESAFPRRIVTLLFAGALVIRGDVIWVTDFNGLYGHEAYACFGQATALRANFLQGVQALPGFHWPQGYPALVEIGSWGPYTLRRFDERDARSIDSNIPENAS